MLVTLMAIFALQTATPQVRNANCFVDNSQVSVSCAVVVSREVPGMVVTSFGFGDGANMHFVSDKIDERRSTVTEMQFRENQRYAIAPHSVGICIVDAESASCMIRGGVNLQIIALYK